LPPNSSAKAKIPIRAWAPSSSLKAIASACGQSGCNLENASASIVTSSIISGHANGGRGRQHVHDGTTVEYTYVPGETRHESYGTGQFKVHDLENIGDDELVFMTIEFLQSANKPMPLPQGVRPRAAA